jgi:hypothetical protein
MAYVRDYQSSPTSADEPVILVDENGMPHAVQQFNPDGSAETVLLDMQNTPGHLDADAPVTDVCYSADAFRRFGLPWMVYFLTLPEEDAEGE